MTNTVKLRDLIEKSGYKLKYIAGRLDITLYALQMKIDNIKEFKASEIAIMCELLNIRSLKEKDEIFFTKKVDE